MAAGSRHYDYIRGDGRYAEKKEVAYFEDGNLPAFAETGKILFACADKHERANGRSYRGLTIAIPAEASNPVAWSRQLVHAIVGVQAYAFSVHLKSGNPHIHLMFSERTNNHSLAPEKYFSRFNKKVRGYTEKSWLEKTKQTYLEHIRTVAPDYTPAMTGGKEKQFSPSQPEAIAGALAQRVLPKLLELEQRVNAVMSQPNNQGEQKMMNERGNSSFIEQAMIIVDKLEKEKEREMDEEMEEISGAELEAFGWCELAETELTDSQREYRLAEMGYDELRTYGLKYCRMKHPKYVRLWFSDDCKIDDLGVTITANGGVAKDNARRVIKLAQLKKWEAVRLSGSDVFIEAAMREALALGLVVVPEGAAQEKLWQRLRAEASPGRVQASAQVADVLVVPSLAAIGEKLASRDAGKGAAGPAQRRKLGL